MIPQIVALAWLFWQEKKTHIQGVSIIHMSLFRIKRMQCNQMATKQTVGILKGQCHTGHSVLVSVADKLDILRHQ